MNFKTILFFAGAIAIASANSMESSENLVETPIDEDSAPELAQVECHPGYSRCRRCFGARARYNSRMRSLNNWFRNYSKGVNSRWASSNASRNRLYRHYSTSGPVYKAALKKYYAGRAYLYKRNASWKALIARQYRTCA